MSQNAATIPSPAGRFAPGSDPRRFRGGNSPRPRLADGRTLAEIAKEATEDAVRLLHAVTNDTKEDVTVRCRAAAVLLGLGWGSAPRLVNVNLDAARTAVELSDADVAALVFAAGSPSPAALAASPPSYSVVDAELVQAPPPETPGYPDTPAAGITPPAPFYAVDPAPESLK